MSKIKAKQKKKWGGRRGESRDLHKAGGKVNGVDSREHSWKVPQLLNMKKMRWLTDVTPEAGRLQMKDSCEFLAIMAIKRDTVSKT